MAVLVFKRIVYILVCFTFFTKTFAQKAKKDTSSTTPEKKVKLAAVPMLNYNRSFGVIFGAMGQAYYKISKKDTISPSSSSMLMGIYSSNKTYFALGVQQFYFKEDKWRIKVAVGTGNLYFQYYQDLPDLPPPFGQDYIDGKWIDFKTSSNFIYWDVRRRVLPNFYLGPMFTANWASTEYDVKNPLTGEKLVENSNLINLGYLLIYDSRDKVNYPTKGFFFQFKNRFNRKPLGASNNFTEYQLSLNHFWDINKKEKSILVSRIFTDAASGDVPFQGQTTVGRDDIRGYSQGEYRGNQVYDIQFELRQNIYKKLGMVGFFGVAAVTDNFSDFSESEALPGGGIGFRYMMIPSEKINIGLDVAAGKNDWSLTFRIGETFGR